MKKKFLKFFLAALFISVPTNAQQIDYYYNRLATTPVPKSEEVEKKLKEQRATEAQKKEISAAKKKCARPVLLKMNGQTYALKRSESMDYVRFDGIHIKEGDSDHPFADCNITDGGKVTKFSTGYSKANDIGMEVSVLPATPSDFPTTYQIYKTKIDEAYNGSKMIGLADGTRKIEDGKTGIYVLPKDILVTGNGEPAVVYCNPVALKGQTAQDIQQQKFPRACNVRYIHPDGLGFAYTYLENAESDHFGMDIVARKMFEDMKQPAAAPKVEKPASQ